MRRRPARPAPARGSPAPATTGRRPVQLRPELRALLGPPVERAPLGPRSAASGRRREHRGAAGRHALRHRQASRRVDLGADRGQRSAPWLERQAGPASLCRPAPCPRRGAPGEPYPHRRQAAACCGPAAKKGWQGRHTMKRASCLRYRPPARRHLRRLSASTASPSRPACGSAPCSPRRSAPSSSALRRVRHRAAPRTRRPQPSQARIINAPDEPQGRAASPPSATGATRQPADRRAAARAAGSRHEVRPAGQGQGDRPLRQAHRRQPQRRHQYLHPPRHRRARRRERARRLRRQRAKGSATWC